VSAVKGSAQSETFKVMERRLLKAIMAPAMIVSWITGLYLAWSAGFFAQGWLHAKLLAVVLMSACHGYLAALTRQFANDANTRPERFFRILNEVPTLLMLAIIVFVIVKPF
jgi:protoporphyrinogen IX oxidase